MLGNKTSPRVASSVGRRWSLSPPLVKRGISGHHTTTLYVNLQFPKVCNDREGRRNKKEVFFFVFFFSLAVLLIHFDLHAWMGGCLCVCVTSGDGK